MKINKQRLLARIGHNFQKPELFELALTHRSRGAHNNERLEFLGDAALNFIIGEALYQQLPTAKEGDLSRLRASLVKGVTLAEVARELELGDHLLLGSGEMKSGGHRRDSILADTVEAIIGAVFLDSGMLACKACVLTWYADRLKNIGEVGDQKDAKTRLQEYQQAKGCELPVYSVAAVSGEAHNQYFNVSCKVEGLKETVCGEGSSRKIAEKQAAERALNLLQGAS